MGGLVVNVSCFLKYTLYILEYLTLNKNHQVIQTHELELLYWVYCFCSVVLYFSTCNKQRCEPFINEMGVKWWLLFSSLNPFVPNACFLYPLKTLGNRKVFWCFQGVEKGCNGKEWVNYSDILKYNDRIHGNREKSYISKVERRLLSRGRGLNSLVGVHFSTLVSLLLPYCSYISSCVVFSYFWTRYFKRFWISLIIFSLYHSFLVTLKRSNLMQTHFLAVLKKV